MKLLNKDYNKLAFDSYVKLDQLMTFSRNNVTGDYNCSLSEKDLASSHLKLIESLQMHDTIREITVKQVEKMVEDALEKFIDQIIQSNSEE